jgi:hypothetical protein
LAWVRARGVRIVLLEQGLGHVGKLVHVLIVVSLRWNALGLILLVKHLCKSLLDCGIRVLRRGVTWLLMLLENLSIYHALNVFRKIFEDW